MSKNYICPHCKGQLMIEKDIIFLTKTKSGASGLVLISPEIGDYSYKSHPSVKYKDGDHVNFICPICYENLDAKEYETKNLAKIYMIDENGKQHNIVFSKIKGQKCTYKISDDTFEAYGKNSGEYMNFFGESSIF
ncbi:MAG: hypothetical protein PHT69_06500 [Bacteroidales bacterium]|nr:hypothetical protein [Bacteroidales bacterium]